ncbi:MAG: hypothetical protein JW829_04145 [Pirellulales bacterium]|nr:hypothetical protein [Pirellulales bacterium]
MVFSFRRIDMVDTVSGILQNILKEKVLHGGIESRDEMHTAEADTPQPRVARSEKGSGMDNPRS